MKYDAEGNYSDFCCRAMDELSRGAQKCINFDPYFKIFELDDPEHRACIFTLKKGQAKEEGRKLTDAGREMVPISYCCWCGKRIIFENVS